LLFCLFFFVKKKKKKGETYDPGAGTANSNSSIILENDGSEGKIKRAVIGQVPAPDLRPRNVQQNIQPSKPPFYTTIQSSMFLGVLLSII